MKCISCQFAWCWNCGVAIKDHSDYKCLLGKNIFELYWITIFAFLFSPILFPFSFVLAVALKYEIFQQNYNHVKAWIRVIVYIGLFIISPLLLIISVLGYCCIFITQVLSEYLPRKLMFISILIGINLGIVVGIIVLAIAAVICVFLPPAGCVFLAIKIYCVLKRRCRYEKKWEYYPRTVV